MPCSSEKTGSAENSKWLSCSVNGDSATRLSHLQVKPLLLICKELSVEAAVLSLCVAMASCNSFFGVMLKEKIISSTAAITCLLIVEGMFKKR